MNTDWRTKKLGEVADFLDSRRKPVTASDRVAGPYPYYGANGQQDLVNDYIFDEELVLLAEDGGYFGSKDRPIAYRVSDKCWVNNHAHVLKAKDNIVDVDFLGYSLKYYDVTPFISGTTRAKLNKSEASKIPLKIPQMRIQKKIVERLDAIRKAQELSDIQIQKTEELFNSSLTEIFKNIKFWKSLSIKDVSKEVITGKTPPTSRSEYFVPEVNFVTPSDFNDNSLLLSETRRKISMMAVEDKVVRTVPTDSLMIVCIGATIGKIALSQVAMTTNQQINSIVFNSNLVVSKFVLYYFARDKRLITAQAKQTTLPILNKTMTEELEIRFPNLDQQHKIVEKLDSIQEYKKLLLKQKSLLKELFDTVLYKSMRGEMDN